MTPKRRIGKLSYILFGIFVAIIIILISCNNKDEGIKQSHDIEPLPNTEWIEEEVELKVEEVKEVVEVKIEEAKEVIEEKLEEIIPNLEILQEIPVEIPTVEEIVPIEEPSDSLEGE